MNEPVGKEHLLKVLGQDFGVVEKRYLSNGWALKVVNDDWGHFIRVVDEATRDVYYFSNLIIHDEQIEDEVLKAITKLGL
jgi:hypothetical protein